MGFAYMWFRSIREDSPKTEVDLGDDMGAIPFEHTKTGMTVVFWIMSLFLIPLFAAIYSLPLTFLVLALAQPIGNVSKDQLDLVVRISLVVGFVLAFITIAKLWTQFKRHTKEFHASE